jgi:O-antigen biosynthesis protein
LRNDGIVRLGYAISSRNHQRDFAVVASALAAVLRERPQCRLVLFKKSQSGSPCLDITDFPEWADVRDRVEWRDIVPLDLLPAEMARFDVNLAPLEVGNPFCEARSELTFFEAALVDVVTVASPTGPFCRVIREGETGFLASDRNEWHVKLLRLVDDPALRRRMARTAKHDAMRRFGHMQQAKSMAALIAQLSGGRDSAYAFELKTSRLREAPQPLPKVPSAEIIFEKDEQCAAKVTVIVPLYNYGRFVAEALGSVRAQSLAKLDLIIVDDCSTDDSVEISLEWVRQNAERFNRLLMFRNQHNVGLGPSRNVGFDAAETRFVLPLDADNRLLPECCERLLTALEGKDIAFAYPTIQQFGHSFNLINAMPYEPARFIGGNFIDAMALVSKEAWASVGGYEDMRLGWEDYDFWCRLAEQGFRGTWVQQTLAEYRVHPSSMIRTTRAHPERKQLLLDDMTRRHPWLALIERGAPPSASGLVKPKRSTAEDL